MAPGLPILRCAIRHKSKRDNQKPSFLTVNKDLMFVFVRALFERRIPQILGIYIGAGWGLVQFVDFLTEQYPISPEWTHVTLLGLALLIPSVLLFAWNHGRPGRDEWQPSEKVGIPVNLVIMVVIFLVAFDRADLKAVASRQTRTDEAGNQVEITVPAEGRRTRLAVFNFDTPSPDTATAWLQYGLPLGVSGDLSQNIFVDVRPSAYFREKLRQLGYADELNLPLNVKRKIAEESHLPYFTDGDVSRSGEVIQVALALYETTTGGLVSRRTFEHTDPFQLIDAITASLIDDLGVPKTKAAAPDLPVAEVLTASVPAFREYMNGLIALQIRDDWAGATSAVRKSVEIDPSFAFGYAALHNLLLLGNQATASMAPLQKAMDNLYRLPERMQYDVKAEYYMMMEDKDKAFAVAELKTEVFPHDISAWLLLAQFQTLRNQKREVIASYDTILRLDPSQHEYRREIGKLYEELGDFDKALSYYTQYAERFATNPDAFIPLARLMRLRGKRGDAKASYEKVLVLSPGNVEGTIGLGLLAQDTGDYRGALRLFESALEQSRTPADRARALSELARHYELRGQLRRSLEYMEQGIREISQFQPGFAVATAKLSSIEDYVEAGQSGKAEQIMREVRAELQPPFDGFSALGEAEFHIGQERWSEAETAVTRLEQSLRTHGFQFLESAIAYYRARIAEGQGNCRQATELYERASALEPTRISAHIDIGRCYLALSQPQQAIAHIEQTLVTHPHHPRGNYEIALAYLAVGNRDKAREHLQRAIDAWQDADPEFDWAVRARNKLQELRAAGSE